MQMASKIGPALALLALVGAAAPALAAGHDYELNGSYADANGGPSLVDNGGTLGATGYTFGKDQGLSLSNAVDPATYSLDMVYDFTDVGGYRKIVDFKNLSSDSGLYVYNGYLDFYNGGQVANSPTALIAANQSQDVRLTRDGVTHTVTAFVGGVQQFSFLDPTGAATFTGPGNIINFFHDDNATAQNEASGGFVDSIKIDASPVPEASTSISMALMLTLGVGGLAFAARKRKAAVKAE